MRVKWSTLSTCLYMSTLRWYWKMITFLLSFCKISKLVNITGTNTIFGNIYHYYSWYYYYIFYNFPIYGVGLDWYEKQTSWYSQLRWHTFARVCGCGVVCHSYSYWCVLPAFPSGFQDGTLRWNCFIICEFLLTTMWFYYSTIKFILMRSLDMHIYMGYILLHNTFCLIELHPFWDFW